MSLNSTGNIRRTISLAASTGLVGALLVVGAAPAAALPPPQPPTAANPDLAVSCGLDIALIIDGSASIAEFGAVATVKASAHAFTDAFIGTGSNLGIVIFNQSAPKTGTNGLPLTPVTTASAAAGGAHFAEIESYTSSGFTNWQAPLIYANSSILDGPNNRPDKPDLVVFVTDGEPNTLTGENPGVPGFPAAVNPAVAAANDLKAQGAHVLAVGVGQAFQDAGSGPDRRDALRFVSGNDVFGTFGNQPAFNASTTDAIFVAEFGALTPALTRIATELCAGSLTITKEASTPQAPTVFAAAADWTFTATPSAPATAYTWVLPDTAAATSKPATTNASGQAQFQWDVTNPTAWTPSIGLVETLKPGFTMLAPTCTEGGADRPVTGFNAATGAFSVEVGPTDVVSCVVRNQADALPVVTLTKANAPTGTVAVGDTITYTLTATTTGPLDKLTITDTMPGTPPNANNSATASYVSGSAACSPACVTPPSFDPATETLTADFGAVTNAAGGSFTLTFQVRVDNQAIPPATTIDAGAKVINFGLVTVTPPGGQPQPPVASPPVQNPVTNKAAPPGSGRSLPATGAAGLVPAGYAVLLLLAAGLAMRVLVRKP